MNKRLTVIASVCPVNEDELPSYVKIRGISSSPLYVIDTDKNVYVWGILDPDERKLFELYVGGELKELPIRVGLQDWEFVEDGILIHDDDKRTYKIYVQKDYIEPKDTRGGITMAKETRTESIPARIIKLEVYASKKYIKAYGGFKNYRELLYDILDRYGNENYFDPDLLELINEGENIY